MLPVGTSDFVNIIRNRQHFTDKSLIVKEVIDASEKVLRSGEKIIPPFFKISDKALHLREAWSILLKLLP